MEEIFFGELGGEVYASVGEEVEIFAVAFVAYAFAEAEEAGAAARGEGGGGRCCVGA